MFYKPQHPETGRMWDTWLYLHDGVYYLYYLAAGGEQWDNISMARSPDGVHWSEMGPVLKKRPEATWMGTGSTWKSPTHEADGKFFMNFSEWVGPRQTIFFAESTDLVRWTRLGDELEFVQDERWYEAEGRWDCIWTIPRPGGGLYGYWTATPKAETGGRFGFGESIDGITWESLEPPKVYGIGEGEVGAIERIGGKYVMMFGAGGMHTLVANGPKGPFHIAERNSVLLNGHTYFSRFLSTADDILVNHHSIMRNGEVYMGLIKRAILDDEGTVRLAYWLGNDKLKGEPVAIVIPSSAADTAKAISLPAPMFDVRRGLIIEGDLLRPVDGLPARGLYIECEAGSGTAILINPNGSAEIGSIFADGSGFDRVFAEDRQIAFGQSVRFRLLLQHSLLEFYLDDILIECFSLPSDATGRIGLIAGGLAGAISNLAAWQAI